MIPVFDSATRENQGGDRTRVLRTFHWRTDTCFVARVNQTWLRDALFPQLTQQTFGETAARDYDFAVVSLHQPTRAVYGAPGRADLHKPFFSILLAPPPTPKMKFGTMPLQGERQVLIQRIERGTGNGVTDLHGPGVWELQVARKGMPLAAAFEQTRRRDLLISAGVELLLLVTITFLLIAAPSKWRWG